MLYITANIEFAYRCTTVHWVVATRSNYYLRNTACDIVARSESSSQLLCKEVTMCLKACIGFMFLS